ncbi:MAG: hypothetical protein AMS14_09175 [Planctomycetes bacterium DG_20]|nr:MAG: hypothetical protein AMS14_09175 [Planctomycetes bacterium DG_20]
MEATAGLPIVPPATRPRPRSLPNRIAGAGVVLLGAALWLGGAHIYAALARMIGKQFDQFGIKGGLPPLTEYTLSLGAWLDAHWAAVVVGWLLVCAALAVAVYMMKWKHAFRLAGCFAAACFFLWYVSPFALLVAYLLCMIRITVSVGPG